MSGTPPYPQMSVYMSTMRAMAMPTPCSSPSSKAFSRPARLAAEPEMRRSPVSGLAWKTRPRANEVLY